jgi:glycerophosphoryl diester phosphodiesterase
LLQLLPAVLVLSCSQEVDVVEPTDSGELLLDETESLTPTMRSSMEGVYRVIAGQETFGDLVALKWSYEITGSDTTHYLSGFFGKDGAFFILRGGTLDSVFFFTGTWRKILNTDTGLMRFLITGTQGGRELFSPAPVIGRDSITFLGTWGNGNENPAYNVQLKYERPLYATEPMEIIAHRAGGRTSDHLPASENSVEMILYAGRLGATGVEIDVHLTSDQVPILYHDNNLNLRLTRPSGLVGPVEEYSYAQLQTFIRLINGERIPTLEEALDAVVYRTSLRTVWLDMKADQLSMTAVRAIQQEYLDKAAAAGRSVDILIGLPTQDKVDEFLTLSDYAQAPSLCEVGVDNVRLVNARVWGPRFTDGTQNGLVAEMHAEGRRAFVWTLDEPAFVQDFIANGDFDGILSNYSTIVAFYHHTRQ